MTANWTGAAALVALIGLIGTLGVLAVRWRRLQERISSIAREWQVTIDAVDFPIVALDRDGRVVRLNRAAMLLTGRPYAETVGLRLADLGSGEPWRSAGRKLAELSDGVDGTQSIDVRSLETGESWEVLLRPVRGIGPVRPALLVVARNTTEMVHLQESLRRQEVMSALGSLVGGVAHEVRNPLFAISATVDALEVRLGGQADLGPFLSVLRSERDRLVSLTRDLLVYGRPVPRALVPGPLGAVIDDAAGACAALAAQNGIELAVRHAEPEIVVERDPGSLFLVFKNLLENAVQHAPRGSVVAVESRLAGDQSECAVCDAGPGFRPEDLSQLFDPFFSRRRGGTGLGLSIAQRVVREHGGEITAANRPEGGAVVRVRLPLFPPPPPRPQDSQPPIASPGRL